jgi:hypothetical protein
MPYAIIPTGQLINLTLFYKIITQISKNTGSEAEPDPTILPYMLLEDRFSTAQREEINALGGTVFPEATDYLVWISNYQLT